MKSETVIAANRFGLGARPGDLAALDKNPKNLLLDQLQGPSRTPAAIRKLPGSDKVLAEVTKLRKMQRDAKKSEKDQDSDRQKEYGSTVRRHYVTQVSARFSSAVTTDYPFHERLVHFWSNHFAVSADKQPVSAVAGSFENEAIRPNLDGKFADLLIAAEQHPAMILYLDNERSIGPNSEVARMAARRRRDRPVGLNENLAREILELHTLGVEGGYSQSDVTHFAAVITGWSVGNDEGRFKAGKPGAFTFRANIHEPGSRTIMGNRYPQEGKAQGEAVLRDLAIHPSTAAHIATKLVRHFVADQPPAAMVKRISSVFLESGGNLPAVHSALVNSEEPWQTVLAKYKTPQDYVISTLRAFNHEPDNARTIVGALEQMGQTPYRPGSPAGWADTAEHWGGADALYKRIEWANAVARYAGSGKDPMMLGADVLGGAFSDHTRLAVSQSASVAQGTTLLLASPDFQRR